jgi:hypothetical protein
MLADGLHRPSSVQMVVSPLLTLLAMVAILVPPASADAGTAPKVELLSSVAVQARELRLSDFLPPGAPGFLRAQAAQVMLGQTPRPGTVRVMDIVELEHTLRPEVLRRLSFPPKITVYRTGYVLESKRAAAALESALQTRGVKAELGPVDVTGAPLLESSDAKLRVLDIRYDALHQRWNARMALADQPHAVPFLVTATGGGPNTGDLSYHADAVRIASEQPLFKAGQRAILVMNSDAFHATIPVVCLEAGLPGREIRVRDEANGKIHRAQVSATGEVHLLGDRNESR